MSIRNPSCIDLILTNSSKSFVNTTAVLAGLSDCHKMVLSVLKKTFPKVKLREILYRDYQKFNDINFKQDLKARIMKIKKILVQNFAIFKIFF